MPATARIKKKAVAASSATEMASCHQGTMAVDRRAIIVMGEVNGNRLSTSEMMPLGFSASVLMKNNGMTSGMITMVVACEASRRLGTNAPTPDIRAA